MNQNMSDKSPNPSFVKEVFERDRNNSHSTKRISSLFGGTAQGKGKAAANPQKDFLKERLPLGIEIGGSEIRIAQLAKMNGQLQLIKAVNARFLRQSFKETIKQLSEENDFQGAAVIGLSESDAQIRILSLPPMAPSELEAAVLWETAGVLGIDARKLDDFSIDYCVLSDSDKVFPKEKKILVALARKNAVLEKIRDLSEAGFNIIAVEPSSLALFEAFRYFSPSAKNGFTPLEKPRSPTGWTLLLEIGNDRSSLMITLGEDIYLIQDMTTTASTIIQAVISYFRVDYNVAEEMVVQYGLEDWAVFPPALAGAGDGGQTINSLYPAVASGLENLIVEIEHSFKAFSNQLSPPSPEISRIVLCGAGRPKGIEVFLRKSFNVLVEPFNFSDNLMADEAMILGKGIKKDVGSFAEAAGLALRGF